MQKKKNEGVVYTYISPNFVQTIEFFHNVLDDVFHAFDSASSEKEKKKKRETLFLQKIYDMADHI